jgi:hypothetical protein
MEKINIRIKYIHMALILNFNPNISHGTGYQSAYKEHILNIRITLELWNSALLLKEYMIKNHCSSTQNIRTGTYEEKRKLFHFPARLQQTSF